VFTRLEISRGRHFTVTIFGAGEMFEKNSMEDELSRNAKHFNYSYCNISRAYEMLVFNNKV